MRGLWPPSQAATGLRLAEIETIKSSAKAQKRLGADAVSQQDVTLTRCGDV